jgi:hypothetical protein
LANELLKSKEGVYFVDGFNPTNPGDSFDKLYSHIEPTKEKPMIVVLEEVDLFGYPKHNMPNTIYNKTTG